MRAVNKKNQMALSTNLEVAQSMYSRMKGLIGKKSFDEGQGMLIKRSGNSIHTFFMNFPIDLLFLDSKGQVRWIKEKVAPWKIIFAPLLVSTDCLELPAGVVQKTNTSIGDYVHVEA